MPVVDITEALEEQQDAADDIAEEGEPILLRYDRNFRADAAGRLPPAPNHVDVETFAVFRAARIIPGGDTSVVLGDQIALFGELDLKKAEIRGLEGVAMGGDPGPTGFSILTSSEAGERPAIGASPTDAGVREFRVLRLIESKAMSGVPICHEVHCRE